MDDHVRFSGTKYEIRNNNKWVITINVVRTVVKYGVVTRAPHVERERVCVCGWVCVGVSVRERERERERARARARARKRERARARACL
jgi:hypothetical protein